jgi:hypothetical protein
MFVSTNKTNDMKNEKEYLTLEDILNDDLVTEWIEEQDKDLADAGWTYEEVKSFADAIVKSNQNK